MQQRQERKDAGKLTAADPVFAHVVGVWAAELHVVSPAK
jgi:hypothetical protein